MKYIKRGEVIKLIRESYPSVSESTIKIYIDDGKIKHSDVKISGKRKDKLFSVSYIKKVLKCGKLTLDWKKVEKLKLRGGDTQ